MKKNILLPLIMVTFFSFINTSCSNSNNIKDGVYMFKNGYSSMIIQLKKNKFKYWFSSDVVLRNKPTYPISGDYTVKGNKITLNHKDIYQKKWEYRIFKGKPTLWRPSAIEYWNKEKKIDSYGVLFPTNKKPNEIWNE